MKKRPQTRYAIDNLFYKLACIAKNELSFVEFKGIEKQVVVPYPPCSGCRGTSSNIEPNCGLLTSRQRVEDVDVKHTPEPQ